MREGAPLPSEGAGAEMNELGFLRTCRPGRGTDPTKNRNSERHTTQHAGKVEAKDTGGGERAHGDTKKRAAGACQACLAHDSALVVAGRYASPLTALRHSSVNSHLAQGWRGGIFVLLNLCTDTRREIQSAERGVCLLCVGQSLARRGRLATEFNG